MRKHAALVLLAGALGGPTATAQPASRAVPPVDASLAAMARKYGVPIEATRAPVVLPGSKGELPQPELRLTPAPEREYSGYVPIFEGALERYPPGLLRAAGIRKFVWSGGLAGNGLATGTVGTFRLDRSAIYLDVTRGKEAVGGRRFIVHHEVFHAIDHRRDPTMADEGWRAINGSNAYFRSGVYEKGLAPIFGAEPPNLGIFEARPGFLTSYARADVAEDKAETFAAMMSLPTLVRTRERQDPRIAAKVLRVEVDLKRLCPTVPDGFWAAPRPPED